MELKLIVAGTTVAIIGALFSLIDKWKNNGTQGYLKNNIIAVMLFVFAIAGTWVTFYSGKVAITEKRESDSIAIAKEQENRIITKQLIAEQQQLIESQQHIVSLQQNQLEKSSQLLTKSIELQNPIKDNFRISFQLVFYNNNYSTYIDSLTKAEGKNMVYFFLPNDEKQYKIDSCFGPLLESFFVNLLFFPPKSEKHYGLMLRREDNLTKYSFSDFHYKYNDYSTATYQFQFLLYYTTLDSAVVLDIQNLPLRIFMEQPSQIKTMLDLNNSQVEVQTIDEKSFETRLSEIAKNDAIRFVPNKIKLRWLRIDNGNHSLGFFEKTKYIDDRYKCDEALKFKL